MSQPHMDHNELARLLDGRLSEEARGSALAHLADFDDDADVLGDAAFLLREAEEEGVPAGDAARTDHPHQEDRDTGRDPKVVPLRPPSTGGRSGWRRTPARWLALAAMFAGVLLVPLALSRSGSRAPGDFAALLASRDAGLPPNWDDRHWTVRRGGGNVAANAAQSARLGVLQTDLEVAAAAGQAAEIRQLSATIASHLDGVAGSGAVAFLYRDIEDRADEPSQALAAPLADARESLAMLMDEDHFSLGAWAEAALLAAQRRDAAFFQARASRKMLDRAASLPSLDDESRAAVAALRTAAEGDPPNWVALTKRTKELLGQIGG